MEWVTELAASDKVPPKVSTPSLATLATGRERVPSPPPSPDLRVSAENQTSTENLESPEPLPNGVRVPPTALPEPARDLLDLRDPRDSPPPPTWTTSGEPE